MFTPKFAASFLIIAAVTLIAAVPYPAQQRLGLGKTVSPAEAATLDIAVGPNGENLPSGSGTVGEGEKVYAAKCAGCHGKDGGGTPYDRLVGGEKPVKTIGSFWPYATTVFDYTRRAMPFDKPGSLKDNEVYAVTAWLLWMNKIIPPDAVMNAKTLPLVKMPNRDGFVPDPRPDVPRETPARTPAKKTPR